MSITPEDELPRPAEGPGASDAVTFSFGDAETGRFGVARLGLAPGEDGSPQSSGLAVLFDGARPVAVRAAGGLGVDGPSAWDAIRAAGVTSTTHEPLASWDVTFTSDDGRSGFAVRFAALGPPAELPADAPAAIAGGMRGYEQLCRVTGTTTVDGEPQVIDCPGQRGHSWGAPDWGRMALARTVSAWMDDGPSVSLVAIRTAKAKSHADEAIAATLFAPDPDAPGAVVGLPVFEARLSTTVDTEGRQRRAGIELLADEEDSGRRVSGEVLCGTSLDLGRLRLDCSFFRWRMEGGSGVGRYDVLRRAPT